MVSLESPEILRDVLDHCLGWILTEETSTGSDFESPKDPKGSVVPAFEIPTV